MKIKNIAERVLVLVIPYKMRFNVKRKREEVESSIFDIFLQV